MIITDSPINNMYTSQRLLNDPSNQVRFNPTFTGLRFKTKQVENGLSLESQVLLETFKNKYDFKHKKPVSLAIKRAIDYAGAAIGIVVASPIMLLSAIAIKLDSKGSVLFKQKRMGKDGKIFTIYKFRTMKTDTPQNCYAVHGKDDSNVTRVGKILRKYSIDEFPQFINILKGDMSIVGPRPMHDNEKMIRLDKNSVRRYAVLPGGKLNYSLLKDKNLLTKIKEEKNYLENWSLIGDLKTMAKIAKDVVTGRNY